MKKPGLYAIKTVQEGEDFYFHRQPDGSCSMVNRAGLATLMQHDVAVTRMISLFEHNRAYDFQVVKAERINAAH